MRFKPIIYPFSQRHCSVFDLSLVVRERAFFLLNLVEYCFTSTETIGLLGTGAQDGHLDVHTLGLLSSDIFSPRRLVAVL